MYVEQNIIEGAHVCRTEYMQQQTLLISVLNNFNLSA